MPATKVLVNVQQLKGRPNPYLLPLQAAGLQPVFHGHDRLLSEDELIAELDGVTATIAGGEPYTERVFQARPELRIVARFGVGYDQVDVPAASRHGVAVAMSFGANHETVADYAFALVMALGCELFQHHEKVRGGGWGCSFHPGVWGRTVGILGLGRIGRAFAERCQGFKMRLLAHDPLADAAWAKAHGVALVSKEELFKAADFVSVHTPLMPSTRNIVGAVELALMQPTAFIVNTARGGLIDEEALHDALVGRRIAGAGLDVFAAEPPVGSKLLALDNVVLAPHAAGMDCASERLMAEACVANILAIREGRIPEENRLLNPEVLGPR
jgi:D-3-phosphoglycerate dehydrogenase / 2-oxoglutarate reductase